MVHPARKDSASNETEEENDKVGEGNGDEIEEGSAEELEKEDHRGMRNIRRPMMTKRATQAEPEIRPAYGHEAGAKTPMIERIKMIQ